MTTNTWQSGSVDNAPLTSLLVDDILQVPQDQQAINTWDQWVHHADAAYVACRMLTLASRTVHHLALYGAAQTIEKYQKTILLHRTGSIPSIGHDFRAGAQGVAALSPALACFADAQYLELCRRLTPLDVAARYPDARTPAPHWRFSLDLLTFLDAFVHRCRDVLHIPAGTRGVIEGLLHERNPDGNPIRDAAKVAVRAQNRHFT